MDGGVSTDSLANTHRDCSWELDLTAPQVRDDTVAIDFEVINVLLGVYLLVSGEQRVVRGLTRIIPAFKVVLGLRPWLLSFSTYVYL